jgi:large subunit ribosomal protein L9
VSFDMASAIRVLLQDNVENLGQSGDVVRVRPGYARNFLIPRGLAVPATPGNLARVDQLKKLAAVRADQLLSTAKELSDKLASTTVKIERAVGEEGKMYGSVTTRDIDEAFLAKGIELDKRKIQLTEPIKTLGEFQVGVKLHPNVNATLRIEVVKKS